MPEGIIFQSQTAYKQLRKMLVEEYLVAVISLPSGIFQPYSGVKTSILIMDKAKAKKFDSIAFYKVENDGFGLGAQRRAIEKNDLPEAMATLKQFLSMNRQDEHDEKSKSSLFCASMLIVPKSKLAENGEYNLSGERYRAIEDSRSSWPLVAIGELCKTTAGGTPSRTKPEYFENGKIPWLRSGEIAQGEIKHSEYFITEEALQDSNAKILPPETVLVALYGATAGEVGILKFPASTNQAVCGILPSDQLDPYFLFWMLRANKSALIRLAGGGAQPNISQAIVRDFRVPLPPVDDQRHIVAEIESYQRVIEGAHAVISNCRKQTIGEPIPGKDPCKACTGLG